MRYTDQQLHVALDAFMANLSRDNGFGVTVQAMKAALDTLPDQRSALPGETGAAVATLELLNYTYHGGILWKPPLGEKPAWLDAPPVPQQDDKVKRWADETVNDWIERGIMIQYSFDFRGLIADGIRRAFVQSGAAAAIDPQKQAALQAMQRFCDRVDRGEVRSTKTYNEFQKILNNEISQDS